MEQKMNSELSAGTTAEQCTNVEDMQVSPRLHKTQCYAQPGIELYNADNSDVMPGLADDSIDVICIDPPYLYLKGQKLERGFDENYFFSECYRILKDKGFIILFGRGESFYRWNVILSQLNFFFKEEIIWDKSYMTSPVTPISRKHETISIWCKGGGKINNVRLPYVEMKDEDFTSISQDLKRIKSALNNSEALKDLQLYLKTKEVLYKEDKERGYNTTVQGVIKEQDRAVKTLQSITNGLKEKSIILVKREHYKTIHPTQKPVRLIERLLALVIPINRECNEITIADFFAGSMSCMEAAYNLGLKGIAVEIDEEYFEAGKKRIEKLPPRQTMLFE